MVRAGGGLNSEAELGEGGVIGLIGMMAVATLRFDAGEVPLSR